jgi:HK97 family phage prohead protease
MFGMGIKSKSIKTVTREVAELEARKAHLETLHQQSLVDARLAEEALEKFLAEGDLSEGLNGAQVALHTARQNSIDLAAAVTRQDGMIAAAEERLAQARDQEARKRAASEREKAAANVEAAAADLQRAVETVAQAADRLASAIPNGAIEVKGLPERIFWNWAGREPDLPLNPIELCRAIFAEGLYERAPELFEVVSRNSDILIYLPLLARRAGRVARGIQRDDVEFGDAIASAKAFIADPLRALAADIRAGNVSLDAPASLALPPPPAAHADRRNVAAQASVLERSRGPRSPQRCLAFREYANRHQQARNRAWCRGEDGHARGRRAYRISKESNCWHGLQPATGRGPGSGLMPRPEAGEDRESFLARCTEEMLDSGEFDDRDEAEDACALIWSSERDRAAMNIIRKTHAGISSGHRSFILSDETPDRVGDILRVSGWQLDNFRRSPIALFNHNHDAPIGVWERVRIEDGALKAELVLAPKNASARLAEIHALVDASVLKATSVGFRPLAHEPRGNGERGVIYTRQELLEASLVSVGANPAALAIAKSLGISDATQQLIFSPQSDSAQRERTKRARELRARSYQLLNDPAYFAHLRKRNPVAAADLERRLREFGLTPRVK